MAKQGKTIQVGYMVKLWVQKELRAETLTDALAIPDDDMEDLLTLAKNVECVDASVVRVSLTDFDSIDI